MTVPPPVTQATLGAAMAQAAARAYVKEATKADRRKHAEWAVEKSAAMWAEYAPLLAALEVAYQAGVTEAAAAIEQARADERGRIAQALEGHNFCEQVRDFAEAVAASDKAAAIARAGTNGGEL